MVKAWGSAQGAAGLRGHRRAAPGSPGGRGAAEDPADVLTATVGEGVDTTAELARHLRDEERRSAPGRAGTSGSPVQPARWGAQSLSSPLVTISEDRYLEVLPLFQVPVPGDKSFPNV